MNEGSSSNDSDSFNTTYQANSGLARQIVERAIADWNSVINNFNYPEDSDANPNNNLNNTFQLTLTATSFSDSTLRGQTQFADSFYDSAKLPIKGQVLIDNDGGGGGWFFDPTPNDDAEFTAIANSGMNGDGAAFSGSFIDVNGQLTRDDFYRSVLHEIGHAVGINDDSGAAIYPMKVGLFKDSAHTMPLIDPTGLTNGQLLRFSAPAGSQFSGFAATFLVDHLYEGDLYGTNNDPTIAYPFGSTTSVPFLSHPNELLNGGRTDPAGDPNPSPPNETLREFISDLDAKILADAYGYAITLPSTMNTAYASLDSQTGTLLVQGGVTSSGQSTNDTIIVDVVNVGGVDKIRVQVDNTTELFVKANVSQIVIAGNSGNDTVIVSLPAGVARKDVQYVVSTNQDSANLSDSSGDGVSDLSSVIPGRQTALRAAVIDARLSHVPSSSIYIPRGIYNLTVSGTGGDAQGDIDIGGDNNQNLNMIIIGSGAGATVIDATTLAVRDRIFETLGHGSLDLSRVTLSGGRTSARGGAIRVDYNSTTSGKELTLRQVAIVGNTALNDSGSGFGGGVYLEQGAEALVYRSVITNNTAGANSGGGGIFAGGVTGPPALGSTVTLDQSVIAKNVSANGQGADLQSATPGLFLSNGGNLIMSTVGAVFGTPGLQSTDYHDQPVDYVVTSLIDTFGSDPRALSLREAIQQANTTAGTQSIWLPAWTFLLTRDRATYGGGSATDTNVAFGDLDILDSLVIRGSGIAVATTVAWRAGAPADAVFDLLGDYNGNRTVDAADYTVWRDHLGQSVTPGTNGDGNDNGVVEQADYDIWTANLGHTLLTPGVS